MYLAALRYRAICSYLLSITMRKSPSVPLETLVLAACLGICSQIDVREVLVKSNIRSPALAGNWFSLCT